MVLQSLNERFYFSEFDLNCFNVLTDNQIRYLNLQVVKWVILVFTLLYNIIIDMKFYCYGIRELALQLLNWI